MKMLFHKLLILVVAAAMAVTLIVPAVQAEETAGEAAAEEIFAELTGAEEEEATASEEIFSEEEPAEEGEDLSEEEPAEEGEDLSEEKPAEEGEDLSEEESAEEEEGDPCEDEEPAEEENVTDTDPETLVCIDEETMSGTEEISESSGSAPADTCAGAEQDISEELSVAELETAAVVDTNEMSETATVPAEEESVAEETEILAELIVGETVECEILSSAVPTEDPEEFLPITEVFSDSAEGYETVNMASEDLLENYVLESEVSEEALYAVDYNGNKLSDLTAIVYGKLKELVTKVAAGSITSTEYTLTLNETNLSGYKWKATDLGVTALFYTETDSEGKITNKVVKTAAENAINSIYEPVLAVRSLIRDCPYEMYWFGNKYSLNKSYTPVVYFDSKEQEYYLSLKEVVLTVNLKVSNDYAGANEFTTDLTKIAKAKKAVLNAQKIVAAAQNKSDLDKLDYYRQAICKLVSYNKTVTSANYPGGYGDPWQLINVFDGDSSTNVVCEGYAKAFQYLCDLSRFNTSDFAVYSVSGSFKAGNGTTGGHLWNIVHMNGTNYMVDLTNSDDTIPTTKLFMVHPESGSVDSGYVFKAGSTTYVYKYLTDSRMLYTDEELSYDIVHKWDNGTIVAQPTCTTAGSKLYTCKLCNATRTESIPATGHKAVVYSPAVEATLFSTGRTVGTSCSVCRSIITSPQIIARQELTRQLAVGMTGEDVKQVQKRLYDLGYSIYVDGDYGMATAAVVARFQSDYGLYVDGSVGKLTLNVLRTANAATHYTDAVTLTRELSKGMTGADVRALQQKLASLGYSITVDGDFGNYTKTVVETFQLNHGLYVDGVVGAKTMSVLNSLTQESGSTDTPSSSSGSITLTRDLKKGMTGADVKAVQQKLSDLGYSIYVDGDFGAGTDQVVKAFQKANGLYVDGVVGGQTLKVLNSLFGGTGSTSSGKITLTRELRKGMTGQDVRAVQQKLSDLGYSIYVDGDFGAGTEQVVIAFQKANGLYADGVVGNITVKALNNR